MEIRDAIYKKNKNQIMEIMDEALELMQQYNGRSVQYCLVEAYNTFSKKDKFVISEVSE